MITVLRLFAKGFKGGRDLLAVGADSSDGAYTMYAAHDPAARSYYLWSAQPSDTVDYAVRLDLHKLRLHPGATRGVIVEEVSANHFGDVALLAPLPDSRKLALTQPAQSVWLMTVPDDSVANEASVTASADALLRGGAAAGQNLGGAATLGVRLDTSGQLPGQVSYLAFTLPDVPDGALNRVILQVSGRNVTDAGSLSFAVYASVSASWDEGQIAWNNAPGLDAGAAKLTGVGSAFFPAGHLTVSGTRGYAWADVTGFVRRHPGRTLTFVLIRQARFADDTADDGRTAELASRESADPAQRPQLLVWW